MSNTTTPDTRLRGHPEFIRSQKDNFHLKLRFVKKRIEVYPMVITRLLYGKKSLLIFSA